MLHVLTKLSPGQHLDHLNIIYNRTKLTGLFTDLSHNCYPRHVSSDVSRTARIAGERGRWDASTLDPAPGIASTASRGLNMGRRAMIKATATRTGATAAPLRSPKIKTGVDTDELEQGLTGGLTGLD